MKHVVRVRVKLYATLARSAAGAILSQYPEGLRPGFPLELELPMGSTLADLVAYLALPQEQVKVSFVNGRARGLDYGLSSGDDIGIFPPIGGG
jgi:molybdopterin converting factor small subunit